jgi:aryl-alcohol dehydrogenase-like predicted oxidoreductase
MPYQAHSQRNTTMPYRRCGRRGLKLPVISLGLWHNFGDATPLQTQRAMLRTAFDLGITHFDLANNSLAQGLFSDKYLNGIPADARINRPGGGSLRPEHLSEQNLKHVRELNSVAAARGQSLAQMATAWVVRDKRVTSALIGASRPEQVTELAGALQNLQFSAEELSAIDQHAVEGGVNLWQRPSTDQRPV